MRTGPVARTVRSNPLLCKSAGEKWGEGAVLERVGRGSLGEGLPFTGRALGFYSNRWPG